jgi:ribosome-binding protein aMBF1 (putative translation factor)
VSAKALSPGDKDDVNRSGECCQHNFNHLQKSTKLVSVPGVKQRDFRESAGMSLADFAKRIDVAVMTAWRYEHARRVPAAQVMQRILAVFGGAIRPDDYYDQEGRET